MEDMNSFGSRFQRLVEEQLEDISWGNLWLMIIAAIILVHLVCLMYRRIRETEIGAGKEILFMCLSVYAIFLLHITFLNREDGSRGGIFTALSQWIFSGKWMLSNQFIYDILNVGLFVPWGLLLTLLRRRDRWLHRILMVSCYCFLTSFAIESLQLITNRGYFEVMDIMTNVLGGIVGCFLGCLICSIADKMRDPSSKNGREHYEKGYEKR